MSSFHLALKRLNEATDPNNPNVRGMQRGKTAVSVEDLLILLEDYGRIDSELRYTFSQNINLKQEIKRLQQENEHLQKVSVDSASSSEPALQERRD